MSFDSYGSSRMAKTTRCMHGTKSHLLHCTVVRATELRPLDIFSTSACLSSGA
jgi:hypothetical protein